MRAHIAVCGITVAGLVLLSSCQPNASKKVVVLSDDQGKKTPSATVRVQITPMKYDQWQVQTFDYIGLKVDLPDVARTSPSANGPATLSISMHYLSPPHGVLDDATVFVHVYVERVPITFLEEKGASIQRSNLYKESTEEENKIWHWYYERHPETSRWDGKGKHSCYRRDVKLNETEILHVHAEVLNAGPQESRDADHAAVKRMLSSIIPLNITTNK